MEGRKVTKIEYNEKTPKSSRQEIIQIVNDHIESEWIIMIERTGIDENEKIEGFPLILSSDLLVMTRIIDFHDEGFVVIRVEDITAAYSKESDAFYEKICVKEGLRERKNENLIVNVTDFTCVLEQLLDYRKFITVQCEIEKNELSFSIGKILDIDSNIVCFSNFDKMGVWEDSNRMIPIDKITLINIGDYYSNIFYKYMDSQC